MGSCGQGGGGREEGGGGAGRGGARREPRTHLCFEAHAQPRQLLFRGREGEHARVRARLRAVGRHRARRPGGVDRAGRPGGQRQRHRRHGRAAGGDPIGRRSDVERIVVEQVQRHRLARLRARQRRQRRQLGEGVLDLRGDELAQGRAVVRVRPPAPLHKQRPRRRPPRREVRGHHRRRELGRRRRQRVLRPREVRQRVVHRERRLGVPVREAVPRAAPAPRRHVAVVAGRERPADVRGLGHGLGVWVCRPLGGMRLGVRAAPASGSRSAAVRRAVRREAVSSSKPDGS